MRTYRVIAYDDVELATIQAGNLTEAIAVIPISAAPLDARIVAAGGSRVLARMELWTGDHPGWSLVAPDGALSVVSPDNSPDK